MFYADLHIHSKYSRATSRDCDLEHMAMWARKKGVTVIGTGDFTHPQWFQEIQTKLVPAEPGLFRLRPDLEKQVDQWLDGAPSGQPVRFMLEVEISTIYKKDDKTRKVHHLIYAPDLDKAQRINQQLARIGNIASDGRPILGLDSRNLLEITLEAGSGCYLIPAHIWTPWFAVLGSKSGFDSIDHCYGDLTHEIFALETGLSSDPAMNWRLSSLDRYTLVSNSDAHSPPKIGREACVFDTELSYFAMRQALETGQGYQGTVEFFPEEGKYHLDGHRKCGVCLSPGETRQHNGLCPACGKPMTLGVMHRVEALADRPPPEDLSTATGTPVGQTAPHDPEAKPTALPPRAAAYRSFVPLNELLSEIEGVGPKSKRVQHRYEQIVSKLGSELFILEHAPLDEVQRVSSSLVAEALARMRAGRVIRQSGYDGEYGVIRLFEKHELEDRNSVSLLFNLRDQPQQPPTPPPPTASIPTPNPAPDTPPIKTDTPPNTPQGLLDALDPDQRTAAQITEGPLLIIAGPGTGKTRTLTHRLAHLVIDHPVPPTQCLAITFTNRAAREMAQRLAILLPSTADTVPVMTFHGLGMSILQQHGQRLGLPHDLQVASLAQRLDLLQQVSSVTPRQATRLLAEISLARRQGITEQTKPAVADAFQAYTKQLHAQGLVDFDDLVHLPLELLHNHPDLIPQYRARYRWVCIDEYQDIDAAQYQLIKLLVPPDGNLCAIGDPDQAIYGFRGADVQYFQRFQDDYPTAQTVRLTRNYRSTRMIVEASSQLIRPVSLVADRDCVAQIESPDRIEIHRCTTDRGEAEFVVHTIERMIGGTTFFSMDSGRAESYEGLDLSFADFAVLYRTDAQADTLVKALTRSGIPFQKRSHQPLAELPVVQALVAALNDTSEADPLTDQLNQAAAAIRDAEPLADLYTPALQPLAKQHGQDRSAFIAQLTLGVDIDLWDPRADRVSLMTLHAAKGLEFPVVFLVGCEDGILPLAWGGTKKASQDTIDPAEERRLFFVGMTRAQQRLILTHTAKRRWRGKPQPMEPSPFLRDIEQRLLAQHEHRPMKKPRPQQEQLVFFEP